MVKKLMAAMITTLAIAFVAAPAIRAAETIVGTLDKIETAEGTASITVVTEAGESLILEVHPSLVEGLQEGDEVEITAEGNKAEAVKKKL